MLTQYTCSPCPRLAGMIVDRLTLLSTHPQTELFPALQQVYVRMYRFWRGRLAIDPARPAGAYALH